MLKILIGLIAVLIIGVGGYIFYLNLSPNKGYSTSVKLPFLGYSESDGEVIAPNGTALTPQEISGADPATFTLIGVPEFSASENASPSTIEAAIEQTGDSNYIITTKDKNHVYQDGQVIPGADPATYHFIYDLNGNPTGFSEDDQHVYPNTTQSISESPSTFVVLEDFMYAKDAQHVYSVNPAVALGKDETLGTIIPNADPATFILVSPPGQCGSDCKYDAEDKNHKYFEGAVVE